MREIVIQAWCDACWLEDQKTLSTATWTVGLVVGEARPALHTVEVCEVHQKVMAEMMALTRSAPLFVGESVVKTAKVDRVEKEFSKPRTQCPLCQKSMAESSVVLHIYQRHLGARRRPRQPLACPDCGAVSATSPGTALHRKAAHGYDALAEVLAEVAAAKLVTV